MKKTMFTVLFSMATLVLTAQSIHRTACQGNLARLDSMLATTSLEVKDDRGRSLIHWAVACKKKEIFDYLVTKGIDINGEDYQQKIPMHVAVQFRNEMFFDLLLQLQPNDNWIKEYGGTLLEVAVINKDSTFIHKLVEAGISINSTNNRGSTPLEIAQRIKARDFYQFLLAMGADTNKVRTFQKKGKYMGQSKPGLTPKMFAPNFISTEESEFGSIFNKSGDEFYYAVDVNGKNEIRYSKRVGNQWTKPKVILSHERYGYNDPFLSNDEKRLYCISGQALDGVGEGKDINIWYVEKTANGWSAPINAGPNINSLRNEYYIAFTNDGTMYFSSNANAPEERSRTDYDIYYSESIDGVFQKPVALGTAVNTTDYEADVFVAPDESYIIFCSSRADGFGRGDLYISFKQNDGSWTNAINMGAAINSPRYEYCPFVTKDGKYLFYTSNQDIYWVSTKMLKKIRKKVK